MLKKLQRFHFEQRTGWYLVHRVHPTPGIGSGQKLVSLPELDRHASSHFFFQAQSSTLFKLVRDKYSPKEHFWRWLGRDIISKRLTGSYDAYKEFASRRILQQLGQNTVDVRCYGVALNFLNPLGSLYAMERLENCVTGSAHFETLSETERTVFIDTLAAQVVELARAGYYHRDLHLDNLLVDDQGRLVWIDTHVKALPTSAKKRAALLDNMLTNSRISDAAYRTRLRARLAPYF
ncbi:hypothetical protein ACGK9R_12065 [Halomonas sp. HNIBRBA4712]|uniref:hypothetical protein n=1 Tax=Halomonas sp. HNIBRBA4712 TaxID=3373087 RepID=UPI00374564B7